MTASLVVLSALFGWLLSEFSQYRRSTAAARLAMGRVLADLLEIRHYVRVLHFGFKHIREGLSIGREHDVQIMAVMESIMPPDPGLPERFNTALNEAAGLAPVLAFRLRRKDSVPIAFLKLKALAAQESNRDLAESVDRLLVAETLEELDAAIRGLALRHSLGAWYQVRQHLALPFVPPDSADALLDQARRAIQPSQVAPS